MFCNNWFQNEPVVAQVWFLNSDFSAVALVWAFGHFCLKDFGLIAVPDVSRHHLTGKDEFVVLATDGIWDISSNKNVVLVDIVVSAARSAASQALI
ncbi:putative protein phosphatase 2C 6 [Glycine soja]|uniref:PPM-type phosphatase domain-containing protein n=1 Tax=Glycine soja TaxID=3848 RepID=A0A445JKD0_GLYSO|nr:putative protein phosphatase 2C 6 [Glycine soja]